MNSGLLYYLLVFQGFSSLNSILADVETQYKCWNNRGLYDKLYSNLQERLKLPLNDINGTLYSGLQDTEQLNSQMLIAESICKLNSLVRLVEMLKWKTVVAIYDYSTAHEMDMLTNTLSSRHLYLIKYDYDNISSKGTILSMLIDIYRALHTNQLNVLLRCRENCIMNILNQANTFDSIIKEYNTAMNQGSRWLVIPPKLSNITDTDWTNFDLDNVAMVLSKQATKQNDNNTALVSYEIYTLLWTETGRKLRFVSDLSDYKNIDIFPNVHYGFNGRKFTVATLPWYPFVMKSTVNNRTRYRGFAIDVLDDLAMYLNFTYELVEPADQEWGLKKENGSWSGLVGMIQKREVDLLAAPLIIEMNREKVMDFTYPIYFDSWTFLVRRPHMDKKWLLLSPLSWQVLLCIAAALPVFTGVLYLMEYKNPFLTSKKQTPYTYHQLLWYVYGSILARGNGNISFSNSGRILISTWWIFTIVMLATYSGNLVAVLSVTLEEAPFNTFEGLVEQDQYKWGTLGGTIYLTIMEFSANPVFREMFDGIQREFQSDPEILDLNQGTHVAKVLNEDYVYLGEKSYFEILTRNDCRLVKAKQDYPVLNYGFGLPNNSPFTQLFSQTIQKMTENGFPEIWKEKNWPKHSYCKESLRTEAKNVTITDLQAAFYIALSGLLLCVFVLVLEIFIKRSRLSHSGKQSVELNHYDYS